jgi:putative hydrolase of the HAD superfamily
MSDAATRAVIFDLGGVVLESPLPAITTFEADTGLPTGFIAQLVIDGADDGPWARLERGELSPTHFATAFSDQGEAAGHRVDAPELLRRIASTAVPRDAMVAAVVQLRAAGLRVGALTNIWPMPGRDADLNQLKRGFDQVVESFRVGMRKPEPRIYELTCRVLGVTPANAIFLDDLGGNLKTARALGMATIKVGDPGTALAELERLTGITLHTHRGETSSLR